MKSIINSIVVTVALSCSGTMPARSQEPSALPVPGALPTAVAEEQDLTAALAEVQRQVEVELTPQLEAQWVADYVSLKKDVDTLAVLADASLGRTQQQAQRQIEQQVAQVEQAVELAQAAAPAAGRAPKTPLAPGYGAQFQNRLQTVIRRGHGASGRALVIRTSDADAKLQANLEEDLAVMTRIFDNTLDEKLGQDQRTHKPFGIDLVFAPGASPIRSLLLEGYGALFLLNVNFPLLPPPDKPEEKKEKSETDSTWERAKRDLYGQPDARGQFGNAFKLNVPPGPEEEYEEEKVEELKEGLFEALKNATNIRDLKPDEAITVCVFGGVSPGPKKAKIITRSASPAPDNVSDEVVLVGRDEGVPARGTIMTIRVKKSDADAFAKGKLNLDNFRKKANVTTYAGDPAGWGGGFEWSGGGRTFNIPRVER